MAVTTKAVETWAWLLIYGGLLLSSFGWFLRDGGAVLGWVSVVAGAVAVCAGVALIVMRSRMANPDSNEGVH
ncbi:MAG: hypothetical protein ABI696_01600 [Rubrivivax sp.]